MDDFFDDNTQMSGLSNGETQAYAGFTWKFGTGGSKSGFNVGIKHREGDFTAKAEYAANYHSDFYETGKSGWETRKSFKLDYDSKDFSVGLGTNIWDGYGEMAEFKQRTGVLSVKKGKTSFMYENDASHFMGLGDGRDSYRTAAASLGYGNLKANVNLFTGLRDDESRRVEAQMNKREGVANGTPRGLGQYGERYDHGFVHELGTPYRFGGLTLNYKGISAGYNSEWVRHAFQNKLAHHYTQENRQFPMLSDDWEPIFNVSNQGSSDFTTW